MSLLGSLFNIGGLASTAYLPYQESGEQMDRLWSAAQQFQGDAAALGQQSAQSTQFTPFSVRTGTGTTSFDPYGGMRMSLGGTEQALEDRMLSQAYGLGAMPSYGQYDALRNQMFGGAGNLVTQAGRDTANLDMYGNRALGTADYLRSTAGSDTGGLQQVGNTYMQQVLKAAQQGIDPSQFQALQNQALFQAQQGLQTGGPTQAELFQQMQDARAGSQERDRLALENRLAAQGRLGVQTAAFGGTPEALAMEKAFQEQASQDFLSSTQMADQLRSSNIAQSQQLFGLGQQAAMTPQQLEAQRLQNVGQMSNIGQGALGLGSQMTAQDYANMAQVGQFGSGLRNLGSQMTAQDYANAQGLFGMGLQAGMQPSQLDLQRLQRQQAALQNAYLPQQQMLTALSPSLNLQGMLANRDIAGANALTQLGMAGLEAEATGLRSLSELESARTQSLAQTLSGLFRSAEGQLSPVSQFFELLNQG